MINTFAQNPNLPNRNQVMPIIPVFMKLMALTLLFINRVASRCPIDSNLDKIVKMDGRLSCMQIESLTGLTGMNISKCSEVKERYRNLSLFCHPDKNKDNNVSIEYLNMQFNTLAEIKQRLLEECKYSPIERCERFFQEPIDSKRTEEPSLKEAKNEIIEKLKLSKNIEFYNFGQFLLEIDQKKVSLKEIVSAVIDLVSAGVSFDQLRILDLEQLRLLLIDYKSDSLALIMRGAHLLELIKVPPSFIKWFLESGEQACDMLRLFIHSQFKEQKVLLEKYKVEVSTLLGAGVPLSEIVKTPASKIMLFFMYSEPVCALLKAGMKFSELVKLNQEELDLVLKEYHLETQDLLSAKVSLEDLMYDFNKMKAFLSHPKQIRALLTAGAEFSGLVKLNQEELDLVLKEYHLEAIALLKEGVLSPGLAEVFKLSPSRIKILLAHAGQACALLKEKEYFSKLIEVSLTTMEVLLVNAEQTYGLLKAGADFDHLVYHLDLEELRLVLQDYHAGTLALLKQGVSFGDIIQVLLYGNKKILIVYGEQTSILLKKGADFNKLVSELGEEELNLLLEKYPVEALILLEGGVLFSQLITVPTIGIMELLLVRAERVCSLLVKGVDFENFSWLPLERQQIFLDTHFEKTLAALSDDVSLRTLQKRLDSLGRFSL